jgi:hypothetical protein
LDALVPVRNSDPESEKLSTNQISTLFMYILGILLYFETIKQLVNHFVLDLLVPSVLCTDDGWLVLMQNNNNIICSSEARIMHERMTRLFTGLTNTVFLLVAHPLCLSTTG